MDYKIGDFVTRKSYHNDIVFKIIAIENDNYILKGRDSRLYADSPIEDLVKYDNQRDEEEEEFLERIKDKETLDRNDYFYLPGKILHIDGDEDYLKRCLSYYKEKVKLYPICQLNTMM